MNTTPFFPKPVQFTEPSFFLQHRQDLDLLSEPPFGVSFPMRFVRAISARIRNSIVPCIETIE
jgi:hypothetical protein